MKKLFCASCVLILLVSGCGGGGNRDGNFNGTDNNNNNWIHFSESKGYSGGGVIFSGKKIVGEWTATLTKDISHSGNSFYINDRYSVLGIKFDNLRYYEYWVEFSVQGGSVISNGAWTPRGSYGVSQDGKSLTVDRYSDMNTYSYVSMDEQHGDNCVLVTENETSDEYVLCRVGEI